MEQKSEQINLEYLVSFEDGLRPRVHVYGINSETGKVYGGEAFIGVSVGVGNNIQQNTHSEESFVDIRRRAEIKTSLVADVFIEGKPLVEDWEQKLHERCRELEFNVIKIQNPEHIKLAIDRHIELYAKQFHELAERFVHLYQEFIEAHPSYGKY